MRRMSQLIKNNKGITIIEILVSFFIIAIIAAIILPSLIFGHNQIYDAGNKSEKIYAVQKSIENDLIIHPATPSTNLQIRFGAHTINVEGSIIEKEEIYDTKGNKTKAKVFIPK